MLRIHAQAAMRDALRRKTAPPQCSPNARAQTPDGVAYRAKKLGIYRERTWRQYAAPVGRVADGLESSAWRAASASRSSATPARNGCSRTWPRKRSGQSPTAFTQPRRQRKRNTSCATAAHALRRGEPGVCRQGAADPRSAAALRQIVVIDDSAMFAYRRSAADELRRSWMAALATREPLEALASAHRPDAPAFIIYTSGTTGLRRGRWSHGRISPAPTTSSSITRCSPSRSARWCTCRCATASGATSPSRCR